MRLLLLFLLQFSLVHCLDRTKLGKDELYLDLDGFPAGSLLTFFFKTKASATKEIAIDFYDAFQKANSENLQFRLNLVDNELFTDYSRYTSAGVVEEAKQVKGEPWLTDAIRNSGERWMRFDLYRIEDTKFLVFFQGFLASFKNNPHELKVKNGLTSVHIKPHGNQALNFNKENVYISIKNPTEYTPKPETVLAALDQPSIAADWDKQTLQMTLDKFPMDKTITLSALMLANDVNHENHAAIYFLNEAGDWGFEIVNYFNENEKRVKMNLHIVHERRAGAGLLNLHSETCTGTSPTTTSTDLVHLKLTRPDPKTIEVRAYYRDDKPTGIVCSIDAEDAGAAHLDRQITVTGKQTGTILHMTIEK